MYRDHEFDPVTPEEQARREQEEEFARRVRREGRRMERGEAEEDIRADEEREAEDDADRAPPQEEVGPRGVEGADRESEEERHASSSSWSVRRIRRTTPTTVR